MINAINSSYLKEYSYTGFPSWTTILIKDFDGEVYFEVVRIEGKYEEDTEYSNKGDKWEDDRVQIIGKGNINFVGKQTGL